MFYSLSLSKDDFYSPAHFQRMAVKALRQCDKFSSPYIDDILIFSKEKTSIQNIAKSMAYGTTKQVPWWRQGSGAGVAIHWKPKTQKDM